MSESVETVCKVLGTEVIKDGRTVRWLELPMGDHPFWVPVNMVPDHLEEGDYVSLQLTEATREEFQQQRE